MATLTADPINEAMQNINAALTKAIASRVEREFLARLSSMRAAREEKAAKATPKHVSTYKSDITKWVPDHSARRVPNFVIAMTKLDTKKAIVAKYGDKVTFELGKPVPKPLS